MHRLAANKEADAGKWDPRQGNFADQLDSEILKSVQSVKTLNNLLT